MRPAERRHVYSCIRTRGGIVFLICVFVIFMQAGIYCANKRSQVAPEDQQSWPSFDAHSNVVTTNHPIPQLMEAAEKKYREKLARQSKSLEAAYHEYRRRYKRPPPKGWDLWWKFAVKHNVVMVDEYDGLMKDLEPFWQLSGAEFKRRSLQVAALPSIDLVRIRGGKASTVNLNKGFEDSEVSARANGFRSMLVKFVSALPDLDFPVNAKAEGRVLIPWEHQLYPNLTVQDSSAGIDTVLKGKFIPDWKGDGSVWEAWRRTCAPKTPARRLFSAMRNPFSSPGPNYFSDTSDSPLLRDFEFSAQTSYSIDFCERPHAHNIQGHFFSDWRTIPVLYPVLSPANARGFMDIKVPSHYYFGSTKRYTYGWDSVNLKLKDVDDMEVPWERKEDKIFWRGATTGGGSNPPGFAAQYQRHRFLRMTSDKSRANRTVVYADPPTTTQYIAAQVPVRDLNEAIMDVAFVKATNPNAYPGGLTALQKDHRFGDSVPLGKHWSYKYLVDIDGMSYSGRFMSFLASDSVPIKSTIYEEFFTDWIQPWVHFIPLSSTYKEIYNIHAFFSGGSAVANSTQYAPQTRLGEGDARLRRIARAGKHWKKTIGRTIDMEAYVYRLCLEYARLAADDRSTMNFALP